MKRIFNLLNYKLNACNDSLLSMCCIDENKASVSEIEAGYIHKSNFCLLNVGLMKRVLP